MEIKKSDFITYAYPVTSREQAMFQLRDRSVRRASLVQYFHVALLDRPIWDAAASRQSHPHQIRLALLFIFEHAQHLVRLRFHQRHLRRAIE